MKKIIGSAAVLTAMVLAGYYGTGLVTERTLKKNINMINQSNNISVEMTGYQRGWFQSKANLTWHVQMPERFVKNEQGSSALVPSKAYTFETPVLISHGPIIVGRDGVHFGLGYASTEVQLPEAYKKEFNATFLPESVVPKLDASIFVTYFNRSHLHLQIPAFRLVSIKNKDIIEWEGMTSDFCLSVERYHVDGRLMLNGLRIVSGDMSLALGKVYSEYDMHQTQQGLYLGDASIQFPSLVVMKNEKVDFELEGVDTKSESEVEDGLFESSFHGSFEKLKTHGKTYGPARVAIELENLDAQVLANINEQANKMQRVPDSERQQVLLMMLPQLTKLLGKGAAFEISELNLGMADGALDGSLRIALPKGDLGNPFQLIQKIEGKGKLKIPSQLLRALLTRSVTEALLLKAEKQTVAKDDAAVVSSGTETVAPVKEPAVNEVAVTASTPATVSPEQFNKEVVDGVNKKIADLVQAGGLRVDGDNYLLDINLASGQLSVNGHPFNPLMLQF